MRIRIGLKLDERDSVTMFGNENGEDALSKMQGPIGTAIINQEYTEDNNKRFRVAYIDEKLQNSYLAYISQRLSNISTKVISFEGDKTPSFTDLVRNYDSDSIIKVPSIFIGEKIKIAPPLRVSLDRRKSTNLLLAGENIKTLNQLINNILYNLLIYHNIEIIYIDPDYIYGISDEVEDDFIETFKSKFNTFKVVDNEENLEDTIHSIYKGLMGSKKGITNSNKYIIIKNAQYLDQIIKMSGYSYTPLERETVIEDKPINNLFDFAEKYNLTGNLDKKDSETNNASDEIINYSNEFKTIINDGFRYGIGICLSVNDRQSYTDYFREFDNVFKNRIIFDMPQRDAEMFIPDVDIRTLKDNMVYYCDGFRDISQVKLYVLNNNQLKDVNFEEKLRRLIYGR